MMGDLLGIIVTLANFAYFSAKQPVLFYLLHISVQVLIRLLRFFYYDWCRRYFPHPLCLSLGSNSGISSSQ